ncbi:MAG: D-alanine--D-alanine ligase family protein [Patescibacteria group bacterium]
MSSLGSKKYIGVIRGGPSPEYETSLKTGKRILSLDLPDFEWKDVFIDRHGVWHMDGVARKATSVLSRVDGFFNALHGNYGEDGGVQEILDAFGVPYTGSGRVASAISARKDLTLDLCTYYGIKVPLTLMLREGDPRDDLISFSRKTSFPLIVKPASAGSSLGVNIANSKDELNVATDEAFKYSSAVLIQEYIKGREASCGVVEGLRGEKLYPLLPVEMTSHFTEFFEREDNEYYGKTLKRCPGKFSADTKMNIQNLAKEVHDKVGLRHYSCSDFVVSDNGDIFFLETDSLPHLTDDSVFSLELEASGISFEEFVRSLFGRVFNT